MGSGLHIHAFFKFRFLISSRFFEGPNWRTGCLGLSRTFLSQISKVKRQLMRALEIMRLWKWFDWRVCSVLRRKELSKKLVSVLTASSTFFTDAKFFKNCSVPWQDGREAIFTMIGNMKLYLACVMRVLVTGASGLPEELKICTGKRQNQIMY